MKPNLTVQSYFFEEARDKISNRTAKLGIIGLGYVGLPTLLQFSKAGFDVKGIERDRTKLDKLRSNSSYLEDVTDEQLAVAPHFYVTNDYSVVSQLDILIICVPTPLDGLGFPDTSLIKQAIELVDPYVREGVLIILESSSYPGTTKELIADYFSAQGYVVGLDIFVAYSPERIDPGNSVFSLQEIPKLIGGISPHCCELSNFLYSSAGYQTVLTSKLEVAELSKLIENSFRAVNIALINEIALVANKTGIDIMETIQAAATKPFGYLPFYPGPGVGGHCIPVDPQYLLWWAEKNECQLSTLTTSMQSNNAFFLNIIEVLKQIAHIQNKNLQNLDLLIIGVGYKKNMSDFRESPTLRLMNELYRLQIQFSYHDPYQENINQAMFSLRSVPLVELEIIHRDVVILMTDHDCINYDELLHHASLIIDSRYRFQKGKKIIYLGESLAKTGSVANG